MHTLEQPPSDEQSPPSLPRTAPPWARFGLFCALFLLAALWLDPHLGLLCRMTASGAGSLLDATGFHPRVEGELLTVSGFTVRIVTECTPLYPFLLYASLVLAQPSPCGRTVTGLVAGSAVIALFDLVRIALLAAAGSHLSGIAFGVLHVYLGQVAMLLLVVGCSLYWLTWGSAAPAPTPFLLRGAWWGTLFFIPWVALNRSYLALLDTTVAWLFLLLYPGYRLVTPRPFLIYNHTFAVPLLLALVAAGGLSLTWRSCAATIGAVALIALWHVLFRVTHVLWTAVGLVEIEPFHQAVYLVGQFLLPFLLWLRLEKLSAHNGRRLGAALVSLPLLLLALVWCSPAQAESAVTAYFNGRGFTVAGNNLNRVTEAEIRIDYLSDDGATPQVSGVGLGAQATMDVQTDTPGTLLIKVKSGRPMSGSVQLATAQLLGTVSFLSAYLRNDKGAGETPAVVIKNPTDEQLGAATPRRGQAQASSPIAPVSKAAASAAQLPVTSPPRAQESQATVDLPATEENRPLRFSRRASVLELLRSQREDDSLTSVRRLFEREGEPFHQEPAALLSDGIAALRLTVPAAALDRATPLFIIHGGNCTGISQRDDGAWTLEVVPEKGRVTASVTVRTAREMVEFPLAVAPPRELFDRNGSDSETGRYVDLVNRLVREGL